MLAHLFFSETKFKCRPVSLCFFFMWNLLTYAVFLENCTEWYEKCINVKTVVKHVQCCKNKTKRFCTHDRKKVYFFFFSSSRSSPSPQHQFNNSLQSNSSPLHQFNNSLQSNSRHSPSPQAFRHARNQPVRTWPELQSFHDQQNLRFCVQNGIFCKRKDVKQ